MSALVADIGGSKSRFALANSAGWPEHILIIENDTVPDLEAAVVRYLDKTGARPQAATLAVAGLIEGEEIALTNRAWRFHRTEFAQRFGFSHLHIVNDFEAVAWALPRLGPAHTRPLGDCTLRREGVKVALGPVLGLAWLRSFLPRAAGTWLRAKAGMLRSGRTRPAKKRCSHVCASNADG
jgi:glucokinase